MRREEGRWGGRSEECEEHARQFSSAVLCSVVCGVRAEHSAHMTVQPKKLE